MAIEVIPFKVFMSSAAISSTTVIDGGLIAFCSFSGAVVVLAVLDKLGFNMNEKLVFNIVRLGAAVLFTFLALKSPLFWALFR